MNYKNVITLIALLLFTGNMPGQTPEFQFIHNAPGPNTQTVDAAVLINGVNVLEVADIAYKSTIPWTQGLPDIELELNVLLEDGSLLIDDYFVTMVDGSNYLLIGQGVSDPDDYALNPDGISTAADISVTEEARQASNTPGKIEALFVHGTTDLQTVDFKLGTTTLAGNMSFKDISSYVSFDPAVTTIDVTDESGDELLYKYEADLSAYADTALVLFTTGFVDPAANQDGPPLALCGITPGGTLIVFEALSTEPPNIRVRPEDGLVFDAGAGDICTQLFPIRNTGGADLEWSYTIDVDWLSGSNTSGTLAPQGQTNSSMTIDASGLEPGLYRTRVTFNSNDPNNPEMNFPVVMNVLDPIFDVTHGYGSSTIVAPSVRTVYELDMNLTALTCGGGSVQVASSMTTPVGGLRPILDPPIQLNNIPGGTTVVRNPNMVLDPDAGWYSTGTYIINTWLIDPATSDTLKSITSNFEVAFAADQANGSIQSLDGTIPRSHELAQNFPNPFNPTTSIRYGLSEEVSVTLKIYNMLGQEVATLVNSHQTAGYHSIEWDGRNAAGQKAVSGIYIYRLKAGNTVISKTMQLTQ